VRSKLGKGSVAVSQIRWVRRVVGVAVAAFGLLVAVGAGSATLAAGYATIYVNYTGCQFAISTDTVASVPNGGSIPYGSYQVEVTTQGSLSGVPISCNGQSVDAINFQLSGGGVTVATTLNGGDGQSATLGPYTFPASTSFTATDSATDATPIMFTTSATAVSGPSGSSGVTSTTGSSGPCGGLLGGSCSSSAPKVTDRGTLAASVSKAGKLNLIFKGKAVSTLTAGDYAVTVTDKSTKAGFVLKGAGHAAVTITTASFVGKKTATVDLTLGQWSYAPKSGGAKTYFYVLS